MGRAQTAYAARGAAIADTRDASGAHRAGQAATPRTRLNVISVDAQPQTAYGTGSLLGVWTWFANCARRLQWHKRRIRCVTAADQIGQHRPRRTARPLAEDVGTTFPNWKGGSPEHNAFANARLGAWGHRHLASRRSLHAAYGCGQQNNGHLTAAQITAETQLLGTASVRQFWNGWDRTESRLTLRSCIRSKTARSLHG